MSIEQIYTDCMNCNHRPDCIRLNPGRIKAFHNEEPLPPRSFYYEGNHPVDILVVGINPGHPYGEAIPKEMDCYRGLDGEALFRSFMNFQEETLPQFMQGAHRRRFFPNLFSYLSYVLDVPMTMANIFQRAAYTNLFKCSTIQSFSNAGIMGETVQLCLESYLVREIEYFEPSIVIALGRYVEQYLRDRIAPPVFWVKHPSYPWAVAERTAVLNNIRNHIP
ncbi:hypothetical protein AGMMS49991_02290 [Spirochaetia bacterium]|nr:hypothetical protein AGMMS49991_02290 [Spirochaetia bacterium]